MIPPFFFTAGPSAQWAEWAVAPSVAAYALFFFLDVSSTASYGRDAVGAREYAPQFRYLTRRWGFAASVPAQASLEALLAAVVVPAYVSMSLDPGMTALCLAAFAACHCLGWALNRRNPPGPGAR